MTHTEGAANERRHPRHVTSMPAWLRAATATIRAAHAAGELAALDRDQAQVWGQMKARSDYAQNVGTRIMALPRQSLRRIAAFTLRCDAGCELASIFGRSQVAQSGSTPNNELLVCRTRAGWRAEFLRWHIAHEGYDTAHALPVACKHGSGLLYVAQASEMVCHPGPGATQPDTWFPFGATRRLSDSMIPAGGPMAQWATPDGPLESLVPPGETVGRFLLGESYRLRAN